MFGDSCFLVAKENLHQQQLLGSGRWWPNIRHNFSDPIYYLQLAEQAQRAARSMEQDYEEVVQLLEGEIAKLKQQMRLHGVCNVD
jgi:hypothetical protein